MARTASFQNPFVIQATSSSSDVRMAKDTCSVTQICGFDNAKLVVFLRAKFPKDTVKSVSRALKTSPRTVENWLTGHACPGFRACGAMVALWGPEFLCAVMDSAPDWASEALAREELADLERRSAALKAKLRTSSPD
jgi:hypothetical protein